MPQEQRRVGFHLPPEVFADLLDEVLIDEETGQEPDFWERLRTYYQLSPLQGDCVICDPSFVTFIVSHDTGDQPGWVYTQGLKPMQCMIVFGEGRTAWALAVLQEITQARQASDQDEGETDTPK
jgi:hypothetical protein